MNILEYAEILKENRELKNDTEIKNFEDAIENIIGTDKVEYLYDGLYDKTEDDEVMFSLVHAIESYYNLISKEEYFYIFIKKSKDIFNQAREWVKLMNIRILNDEDSLNIYIKVAQNLNVDMKEFLKSIMNEVILEDEDLFNKSVSKFINEIK